MVSSISFTLIIIIIIIIIIIAAFFFFFFLHSHNRKMLLIGTGLRFFFSNTINISLSLTKLIQQRLIFQLKLVYGTTSEEHVNMFKSITDLIKAGTSLHSILNFALITFLIGILELDGDNDNIVDITEYSEYTQTKTIIEISIEKAKKQNFVLPPISTDSINESLEVRFSRFFSIFSRFFRFFRIFRIFIFIHSVFYE